MSLRDCFCLLSGRTSNFALPHAEKSMWCLWPFSWPDPLPSSVLNIQGPKGSVLCTSKIKKSYKTSTICRRWKKYFKAAHFVPWDRGPCIVGTRGTVVPRGPTFAYFSRTGANPVSVVFWHITVCMAQHRRIMQTTCGRHQSLSPVAIFALPTRLRCCCRQLVE